MAPTRIVPAFDELDDRHASLGLGLELAPVEQFAFEHREEALTHRVVICIADRSNGRTHTGLFAAQAVLRR